MIVNYEFLCDEAMDNVITFMKHKIDKAVYFGYKDTIQGQKQRTESFLLETCGVKEVEFIPLPAHDLDGTIDLMRKHINNESDLGNELFFDITGGESSILVAFGILAREYNAAIVEYDIENNKLIQTDCNSKANNSAMSSDGSQSKSLCPSNKLSDLAPHQNIPLTLDLLARMHGGCINMSLRKNIKHIKNPEFIKDVENIYNIASQNFEYWNPFSEFLRNTLAPVYDLHVNKRMQTIQAALKSSKTNINTLSKLNEIVTSLVNIGVLKDLDITNSHYRFSFKNRAILDCLWEGGAILELHTWHEESKTATECQVGVHLDWDGIIHEQYGNDVLNEIDVLVLRGNIPTFISCKSGNLSRFQTLHALYELDTVARRFGGKYAKKALVVTKELGPAYEERAREMGIEIRKNVSNTTNIACSFIYL